MRRISLAPTIYRADRCWTDRRVHFQQGLKDRFGFEVRFTETANLSELSKDTELIMACYAPATRNPHCFMELTELDKNIKLIYYMEDCHDADPFDRNVIRMLARADMIISERYELFIKKWPEHAHKLHYLPPYFAPYERYADLEYNEQPKMKCLLSGAINSRFYPIRHYIQTSLEKKKELADKIGILSHPGYGYWDIQKVDGKKLAINDDYAKRLNEYFCCVTESASFPPHYVEVGYALSKYFEIPAAGSLLLANICMDVDKTGLIPGKHYVPISKSDVFLRILDCLNYPKEYEEIRKTGREYCLANHSVDNRLDEFGKILEEI